MPRESRKTVSVVFSDLVGSTAIAERLDPERLRRLLLRFYGEMRLACEAHGGQVRDLIGDAVMAVFGVPRCTRTTPCGPSGRRLRCASGWRS